jgi:DNA-binding transcriptional MerR regulator
MIDEHFRIGEVAEQVGLSLRTIRYYEEIGLVPPSGRTEGGFRLYTAEDVDRLHVVKTLKPLGLSLDEMRALLERADRVADGLDAEARAELEASIALALERCEVMEQRLATARETLQRLTGARVSGTR